MKYGRNEHERENERAGRAANLRCDSDDYIQTGRNNRQFGICAACAERKESGIKEKPSASCRGFGRLQSVLTVNISTKHITMYLLYC